MTPGLATAYAQCDAQLRAEDHDPWLASLYAPAAARPHLHALGAFAREVKHVGQRVRQAIAGEIRLQWWQEVIDGGRETEARAHPVAAALVDTIARCDLPLGPFGDMLDAERLALYDEPPADLTLFKRRLIDAHGAPVRLAAYTLGASGEAIDKAADDAGIALGIAAILSRSEEDGGRSPWLPLDLLTRHGIGQGDVRAGLAATATGPLFDELRAVARVHLAALRDRRRQLGAAAPAFLITALVQPRLAAGGVPVPPWRRQWRLWRAARNGGVL